MTMTNEEFFKLVEAAISGGTEYWSPETKSEVLAKLKEVKVKLEAE